MALLLTGCITGDVPLKLMPSKFQYFEYNDGKVLLRGTTTVGEPLYESLRAFLAANRTGWSADMNTYSLRCYFNSETMKINLGGTYAVLNYTENASKRWIQLSKRVTDGANVCLQHLH